MIPHPCLSPWKGAFAGGLIAFAVSAVSWTALPFHEMTLREFSDPAPVVDAVQAAAPASGLYILRNDPKGQTAPTDPFVLVSYAKGGWGPMWAAMLLGLLCQGVGGFFWTWILGKIPGLTMKDAALYGFFFGLCVGFLGVLPNSVWWKWPLPFSVVYLVDACVAWTLASVVIARWCQASTCALPSRA